MNETDKKTESITKQHLPNTRTRRIMYKSAKFKIYKNDYFLYVASYNER